MKPETLFRWVAAALTLTICAEWLLWPHNDLGLDNYTPPEPPPAPSVTPIEWHLPALSVYREITERPLFEKSRRSP
jgi:hypothetical protein